MAIRIKRHWFQEARFRPPDEQASVVAVAIWKSATHGLQRLRKAKFSVDVGDPFIHVLGEFVVFLTTVADRLAYLHGPVAIDDESSGDGASGNWRQQFTTAMAMRLANIYQENLDQLMGPSADVDGHATAFVDLLNRRMAEYADFDYGVIGPDFAFLRYFGHCIEQTMTDPDDRRWVLDQIMNSQAPEAIESVESGMRGVLGMDPKPRRRPEGVASGE